MHSSIARTGPMLASGLQLECHQRRSQFRRYSAGCGKLKHCSEQRLCYNLSLQNEVDGFVAKGIHAQSFLMHFPVFYFDSMHYSSDCAAHS